MRKPLQINTLTFQTAEDGLGGAQMMAMRFGKRFHRGGHVLSRTLLTKAATSGSF
jgi:hypothetical protein